MKLSHVARARDQHCNTRNTISTVLRILGLAFTVEIALVPAAYAASSTPLDIKHLSLEQLMNIDVYSVSRRLEPYQTAPSAIYVLTGDEIRRAHVTSLPEALRLVPGVQVARVDANKWAVSIRGFNSRASNKLLVMIDGRSIYDPLFTGVLWESRDVLLENVASIEVIRGPGGTQWGANAVNGVINIVTKSAQDTQGGLVVAGVGTEERMIGALRHGWQPSEHQYLRVYAKASERDTGYAPIYPAHDRASSTQAGFRWDWDPNSNDGIRISGDYFDVAADQRDSPTTTQSVAHDGGNLLLRWKRTLQDGGSLRTQFYFDRVRLDNLQLGERRDTYDVEIQHEFRFATQHQFAWGVTYRITRDDLLINSTVTIDPAQRRDDTAGVFVQDTLSMRDDQWRLTLGTKFERNDYSGTEWQPNLRVAWTPDARHTTWASAARAVRVPSRLEADLVLGGQRLGKDFGAEHLNAYELGYREQRDTDLWYDIAAFYNEYRGLLSQERSGVTIAFKNRMYGYVYGAELAGRWKPTPSIRLDASYTWLQMQMGVKSGSTASASADTIEGSSPQQQLVLRSELNLQHHLELDASLRFVDTLSALDVPAYVELDLGLGWAPWPGLDLALVGQNLLHEQHEEQAATAANITAAQRGFYLKSSWTF